MQSRSIRNKPLRTYFAPASQRQHDRTGSRANMCQRGTNIARLSHTVATTTALIRTANSPTSGPASSRSTATARLAMPAGIWATSFLRSVSNYDRPPCLCHPASGGHRVVESVAETIHGRERWGGGMQSGIRRIGEVAGASMAIFDVTLCSRS